MGALMQTGISGFDRLLGGGLLHHNSILIKGSPGAGKTTLGIQMLVAGAVEFDEPGIMVSFEQFPQQLQRDTATFGWNLERLAEEDRLRVFFAPPEDLMTPAKRSENPLVSKILDASAEIGARRLLIDSLSHLEGIEIDSGLTPRQALLRFLTSVKSIGLTPILTSELNSGGPGYEDYLVDSVVFLHHIRGTEGRPDRREIEIIKTRGQRAVGGRHPLSIGERGIEISPHMLPEGVAAVPSEKPMSTGVKGIDDLLGGGLTPGSVALIAGMSGTYKTTLASQFLAAGAEQGERGLLITFQEPLDHLLQFLAGRGIDIRGAVEAGDIVIWSRNPRTTCVEELLRHASELIRDRGITRAVLDSTNDLEACEPNPNQATQALRLFLSTQTHLGVTTAAVQRIECITGQNPISDIAHADLVDTIVYLGLTEIESQLEKVISVLKHRGAKAESALRSITCGKRGIEITDAFHGLSGVLGGSPLGTRKKTVEQVFQPLYVLRDFLQIAQTPGMDEKQRGEILTNLSRETDHLIELMTDHFGEPDVDRE